LEAAKHFLVKVVEQIDKEKQAEALRPDTQTPRITETQP
jgi:hypothetical protein